MDTSFRDIITALTALVGTGGGLLISYLTLKHTYWKEKPTIKLEINEALLGTPRPSSTKLDWSENMLTFKLSNVGNKEYTVVGLGVKVGRRSGHFFLPLPYGTVKLPYILEPGKTCDFWTEHKKIKTSVKKKVNRVRLKFVPMYGTT